MVGRCHVSTGELLRSEISKGTPLGTQASEVMAKGGLVPDRVIVRVVRRRLREDANCQARGWLLDGFPRTAGQVTRVSTPLLLRPLCRSLTICYLLLPRLRRCYLPVLLLTAYYLLGFDDAIRRSDPAPRDHHQRHERNARQTGDGEGSYGLAIRIDASEG